MTTYKQIRNSLIVFLCLAGCFILFVRLNHLTGEGVKNPPQPPRQIVTKQLGWYKLVSGPDVVTSTEIETENKIQLMKVEFSPSAGKYLSALVNPRIFGGLKVGDEVFISYLPGKPLGGLYDVEPTPICFVVDYRTVSPAVTVK